MMLTFVGLRTRRRRLKRILRCGTCDDARILVVVVIHTNPTSCAPTVLVWLAPQVGRPLVAPRLSSLSPASCRACLSGFTSGGGALSLGTKRSPRTSQCTPRWCVNCQRCVVKCTWCCHGAVRETSPIMIEQCLFDRYLQRCVSASNSKHENVIHHNPHTTVIKRTLFGPIYNTEGHLFNTRAHLYLTVTVRLSAPRLSVYITGWPNKNRTFFKVYNSSI